MSAYFATLNIKINKIIEKILENQDLCKLLYYNSYTPLDESNIPDTSILMMDKIFPLPKNTFAEDEKSNRLNLYFQSSEPYTNSGFRSINLTIDIISHLDNWLIDSAIRPYIITSEVDEIFNNQFISDLSMKKIYFKSWFIIAVSDYFYGYRCMYELSDNSNISC